MGFREVHAQAGPRGREEGGIPLRRVLQADNCLAARAHESRTLSQMTSAQAAYWESPGWSWSAAIQPGVPSREVLTQVTSTHVKPRPTAAPLAASFNAWVTHLVKF